MSSAKNPAPHPGFLDFHLEVGRGWDRRYPVRITSPAGDTQVEMQFPFTPDELEIQLLQIETVLLRSGQKRRVLPSSQQKAVQKFGETLFDAALPDDAKGLYHQSRREAELSGKGLRLKLRVDAPELAALPWEFLYDARHAQFVGLSTSTPIVRNLGVTQAVSPLRVEAPLRVLGMIASPKGLDALDVANERQRVEEALADMHAQGIVELQWLEGQTWRDLQRAIRQGEFHVFHFIGHGGFDENADEGLIALADDAGDPYYLRATDLAMLLPDEEALRLVVLNSCDGARGGAVDVFSSTASILVRGGVPAVLAMQYEITDRAAIEFSRVFYEAIADGTPVDAAVSQGRQAVRLAIPGSLEWATPMLYLRAPDGVLFDVGPTAPPVPATPAPVTPAPPPEPVSTSDSAGGGEATSGWDKVRSIWTSIPQAVKAITGLLTAVTALLSLLAAAELPPFDSTPAMGGELFDPTIEHGVTLGEGCTERGWPCEQYSEEDYPIEGLLVNFGVRLTGFNGKDIPTQWSMYNAETNEVVPLFRNQPGWPDAEFTIEADDDSGRGEIWVPLPQLEGRYFVRITLLNDRGTELDRLDTDQFDGTSPG